MPRILLLIEKGRGPIEPREIALSEVSPGDPRLEPLIAAHLAYSKAHSPATDNYTLTTRELAAEPDLRMWMAFAENVAVGCGALKSLGDGMAEIKSVHVAESVRGRGLARRIMDEIVDAARDAGHRVLLLETGSKHLKGYDGARALYEGIGFVYCGAFGDYSSNPNSAFMQYEL